MSNSQKHYKREPTPTERIHSLATVAVRHAEMALRSIQAVVIGEPTLQGLVRDVGDVPVEQAGREEFDSMLEMMKVGAEELARLAAGIERELGAAIVLVGRALLELRKLRAPESSLKGAAAVSRAPWLKRQETTSEDRLRREISIRPYRGDLGFWRRAGRRLTCILRGHERRFPIVEASGVGTGFRCRRCGRMRW